MMEFIVDQLHRLGFHGWYYSKITRERACVRCGIVQYKGAISGKWKNR